MVRSKRSTAKFFSENPMCCFCGGRSPATTRDHFPGSQIFMGKDRPPGFVFPACKGCNALTRNTEQVVALISRFRLAPGENTPADLPALARAVRNNVPEVHDQIMRRSRPPRQYRREMKDLLGHEEFVLMKMGDAIPAHLHLFGAKLGFALHYRQFGEPIPTEGGALVWVENQYRILTQGFPDLRLPFSGFEAIRAGARTSEGQFEFRYAVNQRERLAAFQVMIHRNLLYTIISAPERSQVDPEAEDTWFVPGSLSAVETAPPALRTAGRFRFEQ